MRIASTVAVGSPMARVAAIMVATLLLALAPAGAGIAGSRLLAATGPIVVAQDGSGTHASITEAIAAANDGDTILVKPGTYVEAVTIAKDISLIGDGPRDQVVIQNPPDGPTADSVDVPIDDAGLAPHFALLVEDADATVAGLTVSGPVTGGITAIVTGRGPEAALGIAYLHRAELPEDPSDRRRYNVAFVGGIVLHAGPRMYRPGDEGRQG